jgi:hypothetical protein
MSVCTKCGGESPGDCSSCECGFTPDSNTETADITGAVKSGEVITVDPVALAEIAGSLDEQFDKDSTQIPYVDVAGEEAFGNAITEHREKSEQRGEGEQQKKKEADQV